MSRIGIRKIAAGISNFNIIFAFLIVNFIAIATIMGLQNYYFSIAQDQRETNNKVIAAINKQLATHESQQAEIEHRQNAILGNQNHILSYEHFFNQTIQKEIARDKAQDGLLETLLNKTG